MIFMAAYEESRCLDCSGGGLGGETHLKNDIQLSSRSFLEWMVIPEFFVCVFFFLWHWELNEGPAHARQ